MLSEALAPGGDNSGSYLGAGGGSESVDGWVRRPHVMRTSRWMLCLVAAAAAAVKRLIDRFQHQRTRALAAVVK